MKYFIFALLILFLPSQLGYHFWPEWSLVQGTRVDYLSPTIYFTDILATTLIVLEIKRLQINRKLDLFLVLGMFLNVLFSTHPVISLYAWLKVIEYILVGMVVYKNKDAFGRLTTQIAPVVLIWTSVIALLQWLNSGSLNGIFYLLGERSFTTQTPGIALSKIMNTVSLRPYATLPHPNVLAGVVAVLWLYILKTHQKNTLFYVVSGLSFVTLILTESYSAWIALIVSIGFIFLEKLITPRIQLTWTLFIVSIFTLSLTTLFFVKTPPLEIAQSNNSRERLELLYLSGISLTQNPVTGTGLGTFITQIPKNAQLLPAVYRTRSTSWLQPVHNIPVLLFSETGTVGIVIACMLLTYIPMSAPFVFILETSLFDHYWITLQAPALLFAILVALAYNTKKSR